MYSVNENYLKLPGSYLFSNIAKKVAAFSAANPDAPIIRLGIGDVTQPLAPAIIEALHSAVDEMAHAETFHGYAPDLGYEFLRSAIAKNDFQVFMNLFHYDFRPIEETLGIDCFSTILDYKAIGKTERMYNKNVSEKVRALSDELAAAEDVDTFFNAVVKFYKDYGVGMFRLNKAFRIVENNGKPDFVPINNLDKVVLDDLTGYEMLQSQLLYPGEKPAAGCRSCRTEYRSGSPRRRTGRCLADFPRRRIL